MTNSSEQSGWHRATVSQQRCLSYSWGADSIYPSSSSSQSSCPGSARVCSTVPFSLLTCYTLYNNVVYFPCRTLWELADIWVSQRKVPGGGPRERKKFLPPLCSGSFLSSSCMSFMNPILDRLSFCGSRFYLLVSGHHFLLVPPVGVHTGFLLLILGLFMIICWDLCWEPLYPLSK